MRTVTTAPSATAIYSGFPGRAGELEGRQMSDVTSIVFVVDDDVSVRESLEPLIRAAGWQPETFASALEFLSRPRPTVPLTPREREVMALVVSGLLNKQVGGELGISEITVKAHRGQMMRKMQADSLPELVTMAARLALRPARKV